MSCELEIKQISESLKDFKKQLRNCLKELSLSEKEAENIEETIKKILSEWKAFISDISELLELLNKVSNGKAKKTLTDLLFSLKGFEIKIRLENIEKYGWKIQERNENLLKALDRNRFKLIENARLEKFDEVIYVLERIFFGNQEQPPKELLKLLSDPLIPPEIKKSAVYLFLSATFKQNQEEVT